MIISVALGEGPEVFMTPLVNLVPEDSELAWQLLAFDKHLSYSNDTFP